MKRFASFWLTPRRAVPTVLIWSLLAQGAGPVYAVSSASPGYAGFVTQLPLVYTTPPDVNVMFTLDDSGSMQSDAIPDFSLSGASYTGMPSNANSAFFNDTRGIWYPNMWGPSSSYFAIDYYRLTNATNPERSAVARYMRSSSGNPLYYNPYVTYSPWPTAANNATRMTPATPSAVKIHYSDPTATSGYSTINLTVRQGAAGSNEATGFWPATYFRYTGTTPLPLATPNTPLNTSGVFVKVEIQPNTATYARRTKVVAGVTVPDDNRTDCGTALSCTYAQEMQNFANWLQYYRNRRLMAKGSVGEAFSKQGSNLRTGFARINASPVVRRGMRTFSDTDPASGATTNYRRDFFNLLYTDTSGNGLTPLRRAMDDVGKHFQTTDVNNPWAENPGTAIGTEHSCRRSFHILSTDGYWNDAAATSPANGNNDNLPGWSPATTPAKPDGTTYTFSNNATPNPNDPLVGRFTIDPFRDGNSNTLADVAAYYWRADLRTNLANNVTPSGRDPAYWQHLTTFTIGLGISGSGTVRRSSDNSTVVPSVASTHPLYPYIGRPWLADQVTRDWLIDNKVALTWSAPADDNPATGDDLIHASMVGRGRYFMANSPKDLADGLSAALSEVVDQPLDQASVAADSPQVRSGDHVIQATFSPAKWSGRLYSFVQDPITGAVNNRPSATGNLNASQVWEASLAMPAPTLRNIFTSSGAAGTATAFTWASITSTQRTALNSDSNVLDYLRGSAANEKANGGNFRDRARYTLSGVTGGVLGDIVNSSPVKGPDFGGGYDQLPSSDSARSSYAAFRTGSTLDNMRNTIFLGANDGMLHAFNSVNGVERFAYVPNAVYTVPRSTNSATATSENKLAMLADPLYTHRFTVDGPPNISDAYLGSAWKSILISSFGAGARGIFAVDVTNPDVASGFGNGNFMWEFTEANNNDMGFIPSYPHIVRLRSGQWAALFGNGYDSRNGVAKLFVLDLATGAVIRQIAVDTTGNNGLSQPNFVVNSNREVVAVYAGDLKGNLWKFDFSSPTPSSWNVAFSGTPLFTAVGPTNVRQPITVMPEITGHPQGGALLSFGTGKFFEQTDTLGTAANVNLNTQSLYGVWDKPSETAGLSVTSATRATVLQQQTTTAPPPAPGAGWFGYTTANAINWTTQRGWFIDLASGGERVNLPPQQVRSVLIAVANTPLTSDPCANGGQSRIFFLDPLTGGNPTFPTLDFNGDRTVNNSDSGYNFLVNTRGILTQPIFQLASQATSSVPSSDVAPISYFNRGQSSGGRAGGVELSKSFGDLSQNVLAGGANDPNAGTPQTPLPTGGSTGTATTPCSGTAGGSAPQRGSSDQIVLTAAMSNTELLTLAGSTGNGQAGTTVSPVNCRPRISWRQLK